MSAEEIESLWKTAHPSLDFEKTLPDQTVRPLPDLDSTVSPGPETPSQVEEVSFARGLILEEEIGRGGMGAVFAARQQSLKRDIAVKKIHDSGKSVGTQKRFLEEAYVTAYLGHPNIVPVHDLQRTEDGEWLLAMKRVGGLSWKDLLHPRDEEHKERAKAYDRDRHLDILLQVCYALSFAHEKGLGHNDLKPENVMVGEFGEVLVMDWGLALNIGDPDKDKALPEKLQHKSEIQKPCGTPAYMPPELALGLGDDIGPWTDVYLLGAVLHEILTGRPPHTGKNLISVLRAAAESKAPEFEDTVPEELQQIAKRALAKEPEKRFQRVEDFQRALSEFRSHKESVLVARKASETLKRCETQGNNLNRESLYSELAEAVANFSQSLLLWSENTVAKEGLVKARLVYAQRAIEGGDLGLGNAQLEKLDPGLNEVQSLKDRLTEARIQQEKTENSARWLKTVVGISVFSILLLLSFGLIRVSEEKAETERQKAKAETEKQIADDQREIAEALRDKAEKESKEAARQRDLALKRAEIAKDALDVLVVKVNEKLGSIGGNLIREARIELLDAALEGYEKLRETKGRKENPRELIEAYEQIGNIKRRQGKLKEAFESFKKAEQLCSELIKKKSDPDLIRRKLSCAVSRSTILREQGKLALTFTLLEGTLKETRALLKESPEDEKILGLLSSVVNGLAYSYELKGELKKAIEFAKENLEVEKALVTKDKEELAYQSNYAGALDTLAKLYEKTGRVDEAIPLLKESLGILRELVKKRKEELHSQRSLMAPLSTLGDIYRDRGEVNVAYQYYQETLDIARGLANKYPGSLDRQVDLAIAYNSLGTLYSMARDYERALVAYKSFQKLTAKNAILAPDNYNLRRLSAVASALVGKNYLALGREKEGLEALLASLEESRALVEISPDNTLWLQDYLQSLSILADFYSERKEEVKALSIYKELKGAFEKALKATPANYQLRMKQIQALYLLADCYRDNQNSQAALKHYELALGLALSLVKENPGKTGAVSSISDVKYRMAIFYFYEGQFDKGEKVLKEAIENQRTLVKDQPRFKKRLEMLEAAFEKMKRLRKQ